MPINVSNDESPNFNPIDDFNDNLKKPTHQPEKKFNFTDKVNLQSQQSQHQTKHLLPHALTPQVQKDIEEDTTEAIEGSIFLEEASPLNEEETRRSIKDAIQETSIEGIKTENIEENITKEGDDLKATSLIESLIDPSVIDSSAKGSLIDRLREHYPADRLPDNLEDLSKDEIITLIGNLWKEDIGAGN